jgi:uncharacterized membrane protein
MESKPRFAPGERLFVWAGLLIGMIAFAFIGLVPSLVWGGTLGIGLARALLGHRVGGELLTSVLAFTGMTLLGALALLLFIALGIALGAAAWRVADSRDRPGGRLFRRRRS